VGGKESHSDNGLTRKGTDPGELILLRSGRGKIMSQSKGVVRIGLSWVESGQEGGGEVPGGGRLIFHGTLGTKGVLGVKRIEKRLVVCHFMR